MAATNKHNMCWREKINVGYKNEICEVFELAAKHYLEAKYVHEEQEGPIHDATFTVILKVDEFVGQGSGPTKYAAKLQAAQQILPDLRHLPLPENPNIKREKKRGRALCERTKFTADKPAVQALSELVMNLRGKPEVYTLVDVKKDKYPYVLSMKLVVAEETVFARGKNKKDAKRNAAAKMLNVFGYKYSFSEPELVVAEQVAEELSNQQEVEIQRPLEEIVAVLPKMEVTQMNQLCETSEQPDYQTLSVTVEDVNDITESVKHEDVSPDQDLVDVSSLSENTMEDTQICTPAEIQQEMVELNVVEDVIQTEEPLLLEPEAEVEIMSSYDSEIPAPINQECSPELLLVPAQKEEVSFLNANQETTIEENNPQVNVNCLPDDILSILANMGVITENNGMLDWADNNTSEERQTLPIENQNSVESVTTATSEEACENLISDRSEDQGELSPIDLPCPDETSICIDKENIDTTNKALETLSEEKPESLTSDGPDEERGVSPIDSPHPEETSICIEEENIDTTNKALETSLEEKTESLTSDGPEEKREVSQVDPLCLTETSICIDEENIDATNKALETPLEEKPESLTSDGPEEEREASAVDSPRPEKNSISIVEKSSESENIAPETCGDLTSDRPEDLDPVDEPCQEEDNISIAQDNMESANEVPETEACNKSSKTTARRTAHYLTRSFVRKVFKMAGEEKDLHARSLMTIELQRKVETSINVNDQSQFKPEQLEKIGKKVAKRLKVKIISIEESETDVLEQFNTELRKLQNRPKSGLARFFSRVRKAFTF